MFQSIDAFRANATEEDMRELEAYILSQRNRAKAFPNENYAFSYSAAAAFLRKQGYLGGLQQEQSSDEAPEFIIRAGEKTEFISRSFSVQADILARIDKLASDNWQYSKKAIVNKLLDEALAKYGY